MKKNKLTLEDAFADLDKIVKKLENNNNSIEDIIKLFNEGTELSQICKDKLNTAEILISKVTNKNKK